MLAHSYDERTRDDTFRRATKKSLPHETALNYEEEEKRLEARFADAAPRDIDREMSIRLKQALGALDEDSTRRVSFLSQERRTSLLFRSSAATNKSRLTLSKRSYA